MKVRAHTSGGNFFFRAPPLFGSKSTISRFAERFRRGQYSLVSFLFAVFILAVSPCPAVSKSGGVGYVLPVPYGGGASGHGRENFPI